MRRVILRLGFAVLLLLVTPLLATAAARTGFGFNAPTITGIANGGAVSLTGGGAYQLPDFVHSAGGFSCLAPVNNGPLRGCQTGEGVRWDTAALLRSTQFRCVGTDSLKTATTGAHTVVLQADFYRAGDGIDESFTAQMIVSDTDLAPDVAGIQNVWVQGVGCGSATVNFSGPN